MGKIRVKTLGIEELEEKEKKELKKRKEQKRTAKVPGLKGADERSEGARLLDRRGRERVVAVGPSEEELAKIEVSKAEEVSKVSKGEEKPKKTVAERKKVRSKNYQAVAKMVDRSKIYSLSDALTLLEKLKRSRFDETVELHINTIEKGISATVTLPHGTGKKIRVAIADPSSEKSIEDLLKKLESGNIDFDVLIASPLAMPKIAKFAKILGPRGLMPNPKSGTISDKPQEIAKKYEKGQVLIKTESKSPVIHLGVGKLSFGKEKLEENIKTVLNAVKAEKIKNTTLKSTMSPGIKIQTV